MTYRHAGVFALAALLAGCMEGQKPSPLQRAGATKATEVALKPPDNPQAETHAPKSASLYDRLGKEPAIVQVVDDFVANVVEDENIKERHKKHFKEGDVAGLKKKLIEQLGEATGGPQKYTGKNMKDAHKGLEITNKDFDALAGDLVKALDKNKVAREDKDEIVKMLETMRKDVVEREDDK